NGSVWTIPYEFWCYLGLALIGAIGLLARRWLVLALFVGMLLLNYWITLRQNGVVWFEIIERLHLSKSLTHTIAGHLARIVGTPAVWPRFITYFLAGTVFLLFRKHIAHHVGLALLSVAALIGSVLVPMGIDPLGNYHSLIELVLPIAGTYLVF